MQPASANAIDTPTRLLFGHIQYENDEGEALHSNDDARDCDIGILDQRLNAIQLTFAAAEHSMMRQIAQARQIRNLHLPISRLPAELMTDIFKLSMADGPRQSRLQRAQELSRISSRLRAMIENTPLLWTSISGNNPLQLVSKALKCSATSPLDIEYDAGVSSKRLRHFLRLSVAHVNRWKTLNLNAEILHSLQDFIGRPAPLLTSVGLSQSRASHPVRINAPRLASLHLRSVNIDWNEPTGLRSLSLELIVDQPLPSIRQALRWLSASPEIETLNLVEVQFNAELSPNVPNLIDLPKLSKLKLSSTKHGVCREIIQRIRAPCLRRFHIAVDLRGQPITSLFDDTVSHLTAVLVSLGNDDHPMLKLDPNHVRLEGAAVQIILENTNPYDLFAPSQGDRMPIFSVIPIKSIHFSEGFDLTRQDFLSSLPNARTGTQELVITRNLLVLDFLDKLTRPNVSVYGVFHWLFPELHTIHLDAANIQLDDVLRMVLSRSGKVQPDGPHVLPVPFLVLRLPRHFAVDKSKYKQFIALAAPLAQRIELFPAIIIQSIPGTPLPA